MVGQRTLPYRPIIRIVNDPGIAGGKPSRPPPAGGGGAGPRSWLIVKMCPVLLSNVIVREPAIVGKFSSTTKLRGEVSFTTVSVPPPVLNASIVDGLNTIPSDPPASGNVASTAPSFALSIVMVGGTPGVAAGGPPRPGARGPPEQAANSTWFLSSSAKPLHPPLSRKGKCSIAFIAFVSTTVTLAVS